eukprot:8380769-Pyramimonas_sp.AAC.1
MIAGPPFGSIIITIIILITITIIVVADFAAGNWIPPFPPSGAPANEERPMRPRVHRARGPVANGSEYQ